MSLDSIVVEPYDPAQQPQPGTPGAANAAPVVNAAPEKPAWLTTAIPTDAADVDPRYRGKTVADIIEMNNNAQSTIGRQSQEVGVWRKLAADIGTARTAAPATTPQEEALQITAEDLLRDPVSNISKVVERSVAKALQPVQQKQDINAREAEFRSLQQDFPQMLQWGSDPEFQKWSNATSGRRADSTRTAQGDPLAARRLLEDWQERQAFANSLKPAATDIGAGQGDPVQAGGGKPQGMAGARQAATESGGGTRAGTSGRIFTTKEITDMITFQPEQYRSDGFQAELKAAAREGRIQ